MGKYSDMLQAGPAATEAPAGKYSAMLAQAQAAPTGVPGTFGENFAAGVGHFATGLKQSVLDPGAQWLADKLPILDAIGAKMGLPTAAQSAAETQQTIDQGKPFENKLLWHTGGGALGNLTANALAAYAVGRVLPGGGAGSSSAARYGNAAATGAAVGAVQPIATGDSRAQSAVTGAIGGVVGQGVGEAVGAGLRKAGQVVNNIRNIDQNIASARAVVDDFLRQAGTTRDAIGQNVAGAFDAEVKRALDINGVIDSAALRRKLDFSSVGAQPTLGQITRDPQQFAAEHTLAGIEGAGKTLTEMEKNNHAALVERLNTAGAAKSGLSFDKGGDYAAGQAIHTPLSNMVDGAKSHISQLYKAAEDLNGRPIMMDHVAFTQRAGDLVDKTGKNYFLPQEFKNILNDVASGKYPLTVGTAEQIKTALAAASRSAPDGNARAALSAVRQALEETPIIGEAAGGIPGTGLHLFGSTSGGQSSLGHDTINAFRAARAANAQFQQTVESSPAIKAIVDGVQPDRFFQKHVVGATVDDLKKTADFLRQNPESFAQVRADIVGYLKNKALNGASDEVGKFSQSGFNKALNAFGRDKLGAFFTDAEVKQLQTVGRVASYMQVAPAGARVNSSNTAAHVANLAGHAMNGNSLLALAKKGVNALQAYGQVRKAATAEVPVAVAPSAAQNALLQYTMPAGVAVGNMLQR